jgi:hypothetical protein
MNETQSRTGPLSGTPLELAPTPPYTARYEETQEA